MVFQILKMFLAVSYFAPLAMASEAPVLSSVFSKEDLSGLTLAGFRVLYETSDAVQLSFQETDPVVISKNKWSTFAQASQFCKEQGYSVDSESAETALLFAMSGAANTSAFLKDAISFTFYAPDGEKLSSGIWGWSGQGDSIALMFDGGGSHVVSIEEFQQKSKTDLSSKSSQQLPAFCKEFSWQDL